MRGLRRWVIAVVVLSLFGAVLLVVGQFAEKSPLFASGTLRLDPKLQDHAAGIHTVFISIFDANSPLPIPYGATRYHLSEDAQGSFLRFFLTRDNMQLMPASQGQPTPKYLRIKARLDSSAQAGADKPGDLVGELTQIPTGSQGLELVIERLIAP